MNSPPSPPTSTPSPPTSTPSSSFPSFSFAAVAGIAAAIGELITARRALESVLRSPAAREDALAEKLSMAHMLIQEVVVELHELAVAHATGARVDGDNLNPLTASSGPEAQS